MKSSAASSTSAVVWRILGPILIVVAFLAVVILGIRWVVNNVDLSSQPPAPAPAPTAEERTAKVLYELVMQSAKDPSSVRFNHILTPNDRDWCVQYSATNSFGARVTEQFTYDTKTAKVSKSAALWNTKCFNKSAQGTDFAAGYNMLGR